MQIGSQFAVIPLTLMWTSWAFCGEIHDAAQAGDLKKVQALLKSSPDLVSSKDLIGMTPLLWAADLGHDDIADLLISNKADVNAKQEGSDGSTPLHLAVEGHKAVVKLLILRGADISIRDAYGKTPLDRALEWKAVETKRGYAVESADAESIVQLLLANGATNVVDKSATVLTNARDGAEMLFVPAGEFTMGDIGGTGSRYHTTDHSPMHAVYLDGYWIYRNPVTVAQFKKFCEVTSRAMPSAPFWGWSNMSYPIVNVSWNDAVEYAKWAGAGDLSLPTEAQWEKAARGHAYRKYPWGDEWDDSKCRNSVGGQGAEGACPVGSYSEGASPCGCLDMAGNVMQWCSDWFDPDYYQKTPSRNPLGPETGLHHVLRGGAWYFNSTFYFETSARLAGYSFVPAEARQTFSQYRFLSGGGDMGDRPDLSVSGNGVGFRCATAPGKNLLPAAGMWKPATSIHE